MKDIHNVCVASVVVALALMVGCGEVSVDSLSDIAYDADSAVQDMAQDIAKSDVIGIQDVGAPVDVVSGPKCQTDTDCLLKVLGQTPCRLSTCQAGYCTEPMPLAKGTACSQPNLAPTQCQQTQCDAVGECGILNRPNGDKCGFTNCGQLCKEGQCLQATSEDYDDGNPCTNVFCDQGQKLITTKITDLNLQCDDGDECTDDDSCIKGACLGQNIDCDDSKPCTLDTCASDSGCNHTPNDKKCTGDDPCINLACSVTLGCAPAEDSPYNVGAGCDDGDACTPTSKCGDSGQCSGLSECKCKSDADCLTNGKQGDACNPKICVANLCVVDLAAKVTCDTSADGGCSQTTCDSKTGKCANTPSNEGKDCEDSDKCTSKSTCVVGLCSGKQDKACDDSLPCTVDACDPTVGCTNVPGDGACDDGKVCTTDDACVAGACAGTLLACDDGIVCTWDSCNSKTGECVNTAKNDSCNDGKVCTADKCDADKGCINTAKVGEVCDDGDKCTKSTCGKSGACDIIAGYNKEVVGCGCQKDSECKPKNACTVGKCDKGDCKFDPAPMNGKACETGDKCDVAKSGACDAGSCTGGKAKDCASKGSACTVGSCNPANGDCVVNNKSDGAACDADQNKCTEKDTCKKGKCAADAPKDCSSLSKGCKVGACTKSTGKCVAQNVKDGEGCEDGDFCTVMDKCKSGACDGGSLKTCSELNDICSKGSCDAKKAKCLKLPKPANTKCDDGVWCSVGEACDGKGKCAMGKPKVCTSNPDKCQLGACDEGGKKCILKPADGTNCNDGDKCTLKDTCAKGTCEGSNLKNCDSSADACNTGVCATGVCGKKPKTNNTKCNDGNACTLSDKCSSGVCKAGALKNCNDNNACTVGDKCDKGNCIAGTKKTCNDNNSCTSDSCLIKTGNCDYTAIIGCGGNCAKSSDCKGDSNVCTNDTCISGKCKYINNTTNCNDGNACTQSDKCFNGSCKSGSQKLCPAKTCNTVSCVKNTGSCAYKLTVGAPCNDGKKCTPSDFCTKLGTCTGKAKVCNDGNACTIDSCDSKTGKCAYNGWPLELKPCDADGNACTLNDYCKSGKCLPGKTKNCSDGTKCTSDSCNSKTGKCVHGTANNYNSCEKGGYSYCFSMKCLCKLYDKTDGSGSGTDTIYDMVALSDGSVIGVGQSYAGSSYDAWLMRRDKYGKILWSKTYSGGTSTDVMRGVVATKSGTYLAVGYRYDTSKKNYCGWALEFTSTGSVKKSITICQGVKHDYLRDVVMDKYGNFIASGYTYSSGNNSYSAGWLVKINLANYKANYVDWKKTREGLKITGGWPKVTLKYFHYFFHGISYYAGDNMFYAAGYTSEVKFGGSQDGVVVAYDANGKEKWKGLYGGKYNDYFNGVTVNPYYSGKYVFAAGSSYINSSTGYNGWIVRLYRSNGAQVSTYNYGVNKYTSVWNAIMNYGSGVLLGGQYYNGSVNKGWWMRTSSFGSKSSEAFFHSNSVIYALARAGGLFQSAGRRFVKSWDGWWVQTDVYGKTSCTSNNSDSK